MSRILFGLADLLLLVFSYGIADFAADGRLNPETYKSNLIPFVLLWVFFSVVNGKYAIGKKSSLVEDVKVVVFSNFCVIAVSSLLVFGFSYGNLSRLVFMVTPVLATLFEILLFASFKQTPWRTIEIELGSRTRFKKGEYKFAFFDLVIWIFSYLAVLSLLMLDRRIPPWMLEPLFYLLIYSSLISYIAGLLTRKMQVKGKISFSDFLLPVVNSSLLVLIFMAVAVVALKDVTVSRSVVFGSVLLSFAIDLFIVSILFNNRISAGMEDDEELHLLAFQAVLCKVKEAETIYEPRRFRYASREGETLYHRLARDLSDSEIGFISLNIDVREASGDIPLLIDSGGIDDLRGRDEDSLEVVFNRVPVNEIENPNTYFRSVHERLRPGGYFIGSARTSDLASVRNRSSFSRPVYVALVAINYFVEELLYKWTPLRKLMSFLGVNLRQSYSRTEILGRLVVCGFKNIDVSQIEDRVYFIAYKASEPQADELKVYSLFINLRRLGKFGRDIKVYKFRTMYPYSEYLRDFAIQKCGRVETGDGVGKIEDDFRLTEIGKVMRKYWLDELPQLINILRGEIKLVGIRPLEASCLKVYPQSFLKRRLKYKPGLLAPYAAHLHRSMEEYIDAEIKYLDEYDQRPLVTDIKYFFWISWNILTGKARSR